MAYDEQLAGRLRQALQQSDGISERRMFGGIAFMHNGNLVCGVIKETLLVRLGPNLADAALDEPHVRPMDFTGRPSSSTVYIDPPGFASDEALGSWVDRALDFVSTLAPKRPSSS